MIIVSKFFFSRLQHTTVICFFLLYFPVLSFDSYVLFFFPSSFLLFSFLINLSILEKVWSFMKVICFEDNARGDLLSHLGFNSAQIAAAAEEYVRSKTGHSLPPAPAPVSAPVSAPAPVPLSAPSMALTNVMSSSPLSKGSEGTAGDLFDSPPGDLFDAPPPAQAPVPVPVATMATFSPPPSQSDSSHVEVSLSKLSVSSSSGVSITAANLSPSAAAATAEMVAAALAGEGTYRQTHLV